MCRAWHTPPRAQVFQPRELSREQRQQLGESCLWAEDKPTSGVLPGNGWASTPFGNSYILSQFLLERGRYPQTHLAPSLLFTGKEGDSKVRGELENAYGHCEMKEEGRGPSKFPFLQPHDPGSCANSACLLLISLGPALHGVASRAVLRRQEHFREVFHSREGKQSRDCPLEI